jgi:uncharacterized protein
MRKYFGNLLYTIVVIVVFSANAGSFDDFFIALRNDHANTVGALLQRGFDPNTRDENGRPGLTIAMHEGSLKAAAVLLSHPSIEIDALNATGESALMLAALNGDMAGVQLLIRHGARISQPGWSALHYAATGPEPKLVQLLLEKGAEVDTASPNGSTPLMMAAQYGSEESVKYLLAAGADPQRRNQRELRASDFAQLAGRASLSLRLAALQALQR